MKGKKRTAAGQEVADLADGVAVLAAVAEGTSNLRLPARHVACFILNEEDRYAHDA